MAYYNLACDTDNKNKKIKFFKQAIIVFNKCQSDSMLLSNAYSYLCELTGSKEKKANI